MKKSNYCSIAGFAAEQPNTSKQLSYFNFSRDELRRVWKVINCAVSENLIKKPLWETICTAYLMGLEHGHNIGAEKAITGDRNESNN